MIEFRAERRIFSGTLELYAKQTDGNGNAIALTATGIQSMAVPNGAMWPTFLEIPGQFDDYGQALFDALWAAGYRPNGGEAAVAHVQALKDHLKDMQRLVFEEGRAAP
jgi:hypothetical protein